MNALTDLRHIPYAALSLAVEKEWCQRSLHSFVQYAWPHFDPGAGAFMDGWHLHAFCDHLEAVTAGEVKKLLVNFPPRHCKTSILSLWQVWTWTLLPIDGGFNKLRGPGVQFLCGAYNATKAQEDGVKVRNLIRSDWFQARWGERVVISAHVDNQMTFQTTAGGHRISVGIPESRGKGGIIRLIDDYHKGDDIESATNLETALRRYDETWTTRSNDPIDGAEVIVMQRLASNDLCDHVLSKGGWTHFCLPVEYEPERHCTTDIGWDDPRGCDDETGERLTGDDLENRRGEALWPERFPSAWCREKEREVGPFAYAGQYQQAPAPRGGGLIKAEYWQLWDKPAFPELETVLVSFDGAFTDKTMNDPSAITVWGRFRLADDKKPHMILLWAWQGRLQMNEIVEQVARACQGDYRGRLNVPVRDGGIKADYLLIEAKANGHSVAQEIVRLYGRRKWRTLLNTPRGDKTARLLSVEHLFAGGQVWAPDKDWAQMVIDQITNFPRAGHDDLVDTASQALSWLRTLGGMQTAEEAEEEFLEQNRYRKPRRALYPCG